MVKGGNIDGIDPELPRPVSAFLSFNELRVDWDAETPAQEQRSRARHLELTQSIHSTLVAAGAGMDGATIISDGLKLLSFGAKISAPLPEDFTFDLVNLPWSEQKDASSKDLKGTRHRSAAALVHKNASASAIVISQDGYVTLFTRATGTERVVAFKGLEYYLEADLSLP
jgi:hypothetical protein